MLSLAVAQNQQIEITTEGEDLVKASRYAAQSGVPLFYVGLGDAHEVRDLKLHDLQVEDSVRVNDRLETSAENVWALGDVTGGPAFTHISYNDYQIIYGNLFEGQNLSTGTRIVPYAVFTDPQLGRGGVTEK